MVHVNNRLVVSFLMLVFMQLISSIDISAQKNVKTVQKEYDVAAFLYPAYASDDPRLLPFWPKGIGEWETVANMQERNPGHYWNRKPLWGYINEADPSVMSMEIEAATKHGVDVFIFDWYWYDNRPFMETTLNNGFLKADNVGKMKFYLMWANHDVGNTWDTRISHEPNIIWEGKVDRQEFEKICKRNIEKYFKHPQYYKIDGKPVFMIYDIPQLISGLGGVEETVSALKWFDDETKKAGFPGVDLQLTMWSINLNHSGFDGSKTENPEREFVKKLGFTSATHYQFVHFTNVDQDYMKIMEAVKKEWERIDANFDFKYYPHVSVGWDNSPRLGSSAVVKIIHRRTFRKHFRWQKNM